MIFSIKTFIKQIIARNGLNFCDDVSFHITHSYKFTSVDQQYSITDCATATEKLEK